MTIIYLPSYDPNFPLITLQILNLFCSCMRTPVYAQGTSARGDAFGMIMIMLTSSATDTKISEDKRSGL